MNIGTGHGASVGRTVKGIMSVFLPLLHISRSHFCVLTVWALKIEDGKESMKEEERGEERWKHSESECKEERKRTGRLEG